MQNDTMTITLQSSIKQTDIHKVINTNYSDLFNYLVEGAMVQLPCGRCDGVELTTLPALSNSYVEATSVSAVFVVIDTSAILHKEATGTQIHNYSITLQQQCTA